MESREDKSYLPEEWASDERMRVLMGPMPVGVQEEVARAARHTFWAAAINRWCQITERPCFTFLECQNAFRRGTQLPLCLPEVLMRMISLGEVAPLESLILGEQKAESWLGWGRRILVARPARLAWDVVRRTAGFNGIEGATLISSRVLQEMCRSVQEKVWAYETTNSTTPSVMTLGELQSLVGLPADTLHLLVEALAGEGRAAITIHETTTHVKFAHPGDTARPTIDQVELAESDLRRTEQRVQANVTSLREERAALRGQAKAALHNGSRAEACSLLRRKKRIEKSLETQLGTLENLTAWLHHLQESQTNRQVLGAFRGSVEALRTALAGENSADSAAATLDDLQQLLEECEDLSSVLSAKSPQDEEDTHALETELNQLMIDDQRNTQQQQQQQQQQLEEQEMQLPDIPSAEPVVSVYLTS